MCVCTQITVTVVVPIILSLWQNISKKLSIIKNRKNLELVVTIVKGILIEYTKNLTSVSFPSSSYSVLPFCRRLEIRV